MDERRNYKRAEVLIDAEITWSNQNKVVMPVSNLSLGGVYLEADDKCALKGKSLPIAGTEVDVTLLVYIEDKIYHTMKSRVVRADKDGIALQFTNCDVKYLSFLEKVLEFKAKRLRIA